jgi:hypothetical protein
MSKSFFFEGNHIHKLDQFNDTNKFIIEIGEYKFKYSKEQLLFLSNRAIKHFHHSDLPFEIKFPDYQINFTFNDLVDSFKSIDALFHSQKK